MADNEEISPAVSDEANTRPDKRVNSTPSTERSKGSQLLASRRQSQESLSSSCSPSESASSSSKDSDSSKSDSRHTAHKKRQKPAERDTSNNTPPKHEGDEYVCFNTKTKACHKLDLTKHMVKYVNDKFTTYVKDKSIHETVLDSNPVPSIDCLKTPAVDDYMDEIFETLGKSYGRENDNNLSKVQSRLTNVMGPLGKLWLTLEKVRTGESSEDLDLFDCLRLVEQSVSLLGQAKVSLSYTRRLAVLFRLTGDMKKAKKLLT